MSFICVLGWNLWERASRNIMTVKSQEDDWGIAVRRSHFRIDEEFWINVTDHIIILLFGRGLLLRKYKDFKLVNLSSEIFDNCFC